MTLSHDDTLLFINIVLDAPIEKSREILHIRLSISEKNEGQFYQGIIKHGRGMKLTNDQWFELLSRLPIRMLRADLDLTGLLSEEQIKRLPPTTG